MPWTCPCRPHVHPVMTWTWPTPPQCLGLTPTPGTDPGKPMSAACWGLSASHLLLTLVCVLPVPPYCCCLPVAHWLLPIIACSPLPVTCCIWSFHLVLATLCQLATGTLPYRYHSLLWSATQLPVVPFKQCMLVFLLKKHHLSARAPKYQTYIQNMFASNFLPVAWHECCTVYGLSCHWWT